MSNQYTVLFREIPHHFIANSLQEWWQQIEHHVKLPRNQIFVVDKQSPWTDIFSLPWPLRHDKTWLVLEIPSAEQMESEYREDHWNKLIEEPEEKMHVWLHDSRNVHVPNLFQQVVHRFLNTYQSSPEQSSTDWQMQKWLNYLQWCVQHEHQLSPLVKQWILKVGCMTDRMTPKMNEKIQKIMQVMFDRDLEE